MPTPGPGWATPEPLQDSEPLQGFFTDASRWASVFGEGLLLD